MAQRLLHWFLASAVLLCCVSLGRADEATLSDFRRFYRAMETRGERVEAVLALEGIDDPRVVGLLVPVLESPEPEVVEAALRVLGGLKADGSRSALGSALVGSKSAPVRVGLLRAATRGRFALDENLTKALDAGLSDKAWAVRLAALAYLGSTATEGAEGRLVPLVGDPEPAVRAGALDALAALGTPGAVDAAFSALSDGVWQVRSAAIGLLQRVRDVRSVPVLIQRMEVEEGRLRADAARALEELTGRFFGLDLDGWKRFWGTFGASYQLPTQAEIERQRAARAASSARYVAPGATSYHGIETPSRAVVFVIDVSGSMETHVVEKERFREGNYPSFARIDIVKTELMRTIERLEPHVRFNILAFATEVQPWRKSLVPATALHKKSALDWVGKLKPLGTAEDQQLASIGLGAASNLHLGRTNTFGALAAALGVSDPRAPTTGDYRTEVDTVFFLSDGKPTHGEFIDEADILRAVADLNRLRRIVLHTIAIGDFASGFMATLAADHGGVFVDLGR